MAQIQAGETFSDGELVTADRMNDIVGEAKALNGIITEQKSLTASELESDVLTDAIPVSNLDRILVYDESNDGIRQTTVGNLFQSNNPIATELVEGDGLMLRQTSGMLSIGNPLIGMGETADVTIVGNTVISGWYTEIGSLLKVTGNQEVSGDAEIAGDLSVLGETELKNTVIDGNLTLTGSFVSDDALAREKVFEINQESSVTVFNLTTAPTGVSPFIPSPTRTPYEIKLGNVEVGFRQGIVSFPQFKIRLRKGGQGISQEARVKIDLIAYKDPSNPINPLQKEYVIAGFRDSISSVESNPSYDLTNTCPPWVELVTPSGINLTQYKLKLRFTGDLAYTTPSDVYRNQILFDYQVLSFKSFFKIRILSKREEDNVSTSYSPYEQNDIQAPLVGSNDFSGNWQNLRFGKKVPFIANQSVYEV